MSYGRDRDAASRGIGAIASRDMSHPQAVRRRQIAKARATNARDRMLAGVTYGARGGIVGGLGALNTATNTVGGLTGGARRPVLVRGGVIEGGGQTPIQIASNHAAGLPPRTILPLPPKPPVVGTNQVAAAVAAITPSPSKPGTKLPGSRPAPTPLPEPVSPVKTGSGSGSSGSSGGGGGGGGSSGSSSGTTLPEYTDPDVPDIDETMVDAPAAKMSTAKMLAIGGGIAAVLYLLLNGED